MNFDRVSGIWLWEWYLALRVVFGPGSGIWHWEWDLALRVGFGAESGIWPWEWDLTLRVGFYFYLSGIWLETLSCMGGIWLSGIRNHIPLWLRPRGIWFHISLLPSKDMIIFHSLSMGYLLVTHFCIGLLNLFQLSLQNMHISWDICCSIASNLEPMFYINFLIPLDLADKLFWSPINLETFTTYIIILKHYSSRCTDQT